MSKLLNYYENKELYNANPPEDYTISFVEDTQEIIVNGISFGNISISRVANSQEE